MTREILIVDDSALNRELFQDMLELGGYTVSVAVNGREGVIRARESRPDAILMDIGMPVMDGYEATELLGGNPETAEIPVIAITARSSPRDRRRIDEGRFECRLPKPVGLQELLSTVERTVGPPATPAGGA